VSDPRLIATLGFISAISRSILAIASLGLIDDEDEPVPEPSPGRYHGPPAPPPPRFGPVMAACLLLVGAQQSGLDKAPTP
jgi:hypothetical protein